MYKHRLQPGLGSVVAPAHSHEDTGCLVQQVLLLLAAAAAAHASLDDVQQWLQQLQDQGALRLPGHQHLNEV